MKKVVKRIANSIKNGWPHIEICKSANMECWRVYGFRWYFRLCIFDWTKTRFYPGQPAYWRVRLFGWTIIERNRQWSGLPGVR